MIRTIAVGDTHGHYRQLIELLDLLEYNHNVDFEKDRFVFLGDYVDGGPDTKQLIEQLIYFKETYPHWRFLYGNHEDLLLDAYNPYHPTYHDYYLWFNQGGEETLRSYVKDMTSDPYEQRLINMSQAIPSDHIEFLKRLDTYFEDDKYFYVHGGLEEQSIEWCKENMKRYDMIWMREPFINSRFNWGKKIIFGHTIDFDGRYQRTKGGPLRPIIKKNKIGIDTFAHNVGRLTAVILPEETIVQTKWYDNAAKE